MQRVLVGGIVGAMIVGACWYFGGLEKVRVRGGMGRTAALSVPAAASVRDRTQPPQTGAPRTLGDRSPAEAEPAAENDNAKDVQAAAFGALFWFNWKEISEQGHPLYGAYVYQKLLPVLAPGSEQAPAGWVVLFDGDLFSDLPPQIRATGADESRCLNEVHRVGPKQCYVVAMFGEGASFQAIDEALHRSGVTGYLGKTSCPGLDAKGFVALARSLSLPVAARIEGAMFKKIGFGFMSDDRLRAMGFEPVQARR